MFVIFVFLLEKFTTLHKNNTFQNKNYLLGIKKNKIKIYNKAKVSTAY